MCDEVLVAGLTVGYARVSTDAQDLTVQRDALARLRVPADRVDADHGLTGTNRARRGLERALAAVRSGDLFVVTKLDRLARSVPDARNIVHDPTDPVGRLLLTVLSMIAEFEGDLIRSRTREGMAIAKAKGRLRGRAPKLSKSQEAHLVGLYRAGRHTTGELAELSGVSRATVYRAVARAGPPPEDPVPGGASASPPERPAAEEPKPSTRGRTR